MIVCACVSVCGGGVVKGKGRERLLAYLCSRQIVHIGFLIAKGH